jgi:phage terminase large subunit-like protein
MSNQAEKALKTPIEGLQGASEPRIHTPLNDLPSLGHEMIEFVESLINPNTGETFRMTPAQKFLAIHAHKIKPDGRWASPEVAALQARQNGKTTFMAWRVLMGMYRWNERLQVGTAHKLTTSSETFFKIYEIIEANPPLLAEFQKKIESKGGQELKLLNGNRYIIRANNSAARGVAAPAAIHMDEVREYKDEEVWASMRYTQMAVQGRGGQAWMYSNAGDQHSIILNKMRERALAQIAGAEDSLAWFEWSGVPDVPIDVTSEKFWESIKMANPSLGFTIHPDNIRAVLHDDDSIIRTEVLCNWVDTINPVIAPEAWKNCKIEKKLDPDKTTWMGIDLSPDRKHGALMAAQRLGKDEFLVVLLNTWDSPAPLDDKMMANQIADWVKKFSTQMVAYSIRTSANIAARLKPAGIPVESIDGADYAQACDEMLSAVNAGRLKHIDQPELNKQVLAAVKLPFGDGGWIMGRKASNAVIAASVATAMVAHYATRPESDDDIVIG